jgi:hypothetical protein
MAIAFGTPDVDDDDIDGDDAGWNQCNIPPTLDSNGSI